MLVERKGASLFVFLFLEVLFLELKLLFLLFKLQLLVRSKLARIDK